MPNKTLHENNLLYYSRYSKGYYGSKSKIARESALDIVRTLQEKTPCEWCGTPKPPEINICHSCMQYIMFCNKDPELDPT